MDFALGSNDAAVQQNSAKHFEAPSISGAAIAIVVDDIGSEWRNTPKLIEIDGELTFSTLPDYPYTEQALKTIREKNREIMIHVPMQPREQNKYAADAGILWRGMTTNEISRLIDHELDSIPDAVGANNHMGSAFTEWKDGMQIVLGELQKRNMYFIDSVTGGNKISYELAGEMGLKCYARDIFMDTENSYSYVKMQFNKLIDIAKKNGSALAICHPRAATVVVLRDEIPKLRNYGVRLVPASAIAQIKRDNAVNREGEK